MTMLTPLEEAIHNATPAKLAEVLRYLGKAELVALELDRRRPVPVPPFQDRVAPWMLECFGAAVAADMTERGDRLAEEVLELLQSHGYDIAGRIPALVAYTDARPPGEPAQEVGGVMVTLAAYCLAARLDMHRAGEFELARILRPEVTARIREKQAAKARDIPFSPLPQAVAPIGCGVQLHVPFDTCGQIERGAPALCGACAQVAGVAPFYAEDALPKVVPIPTLDTEAAAYAADMGDRWDTMGEEAREAARQVIRDEHAARDQLGRA